MKYTYKYDKITLVFRKDGWVSLIWVCSLMASKNVHLIVLSGDCPPIMGHKCHNRLYEEGLYNPLYATYIIYTYMFLNICSESTMRILASQTSSLRKPSPLLTSQQKVLLFISRTSSRPLAMTAHSSSS